MSQSSPACRSRSMAPLQLPHEGQDCKPTGREDGMFARPLNWVRTDAETKLRTLSKRFIQEGLLREVQRFPRSAGKWHSIWIGPTEGDPVCGNQGPSRAGMSAEGCRCFQGLVSFRSTFILLFRENVDGKSGRPSRRRRRNAQMQKHCRRRRNMPALEAPELRARQAASGILSASASGRVPFSHGVILHGKDGAGYGPDYLVVRDRRREQRTGRSQ